MFIYFGDEVDNAFPKSHLIEIVLVDAFAYMLKIVLCPNS